MNKDSHDEERDHKKRDDEDRDHDEEQDLSAAGPSSVAGPFGAAGLSGLREQRTVHLRPGDKREVQRVLRTRPYYKSLSRVLQDQLLRSLLPRIEAGLLSPRRLALEVSGRKAEPPPREPVQVSLRNWASLERAARAANRGIRRLERKVAWRGSLQPFPFCRLGPAMIVRAAAREIAVATRGGDSRFFSREWTWGEGTLRGEGAPKSEGTPNDNGDPKSSPPGGKEPSGKEPSGSTLGGGEPGGDSPNDNSPNGDSQNGGGSNDNSSDNGYQVLKKLPDRDRGGKPVRMVVSRNAVRKLTRSAEGWPWEGSDLARRAIQVLLRWVEEDPTKAFSFIREESGLYQPRGEGGYGGYQVYIEPWKKRRLKQARETLQEGPGAKLGRRITQREILQAAARLAIEFEEEAYPPPPGEAPSPGQGLSLGQEPPFE